MKASIASQTKLPPSPEIKAISGITNLRQHQVPSFLLNDRQEDDVSAADTSEGRLVSLARYDVFEPQALACAAQKGAVAGPEGISVFHLDQPHVPVLILSHKTTSGRISQLAFDKSSEATNLASARGSGILVWDVSGQSLSPLQGRLGTNNGDAISSLTWTDGNLIAATSATTASLWDIRASLSSQRPVLRFGVDASASYQQICCGCDTEFATMDANGILRVFDTRTTRASSVVSKSSPLMQWSAYDHAGVGLTFLTGSGCWVSWGLDAPMSDATVKVWKSGADFCEIGRPEESYWFMDGSPVSGERKLSQRCPYRLVGRCTTENLSCARVCPDPVEDSLVTVGWNKKGWKTDLWKLRNPNSSDQSYLEQTVTFQQDPVLQSVVGMDTGSLIGAEVALVSYTGRNTSQDQRDSRLLLCSLTGDGFVATHAIPEALPLAVSNSKRSSSAEKESSSHAYSTKLFPLDWEASVTDAARPWSKESLTKASERTLDRRDAPSTTPSGVGSTGAVDGGLLPFDMDLPVAYTMMKSGLPTTGMKDMISPSGGSVMGSSDDQSDRGIFDTAVLMESIETDRIPCPRLCGASFSQGVGGLVAFHNGSVKRMWRWWERSNPTRLAAVPGLIGEPSLNDPKYEDARVVGEALNVPGPKIPTTNCPRTLKDLVDMTGAAKNQAEFGLQDDSEASSATSHAMNNNLFDDESASSSESADDQIDTIEDEKGRMYDSYFSGYQRPLLDPLISQDSTDQQDRQEPSEGLFSPTIGLTSDVLSPLVKVSHKYDEIAFNNQTAKLALGLALGSFQLEESYEVSGCQMSSENAENADYPATHDASAQSAEARSTTATPSRRALPTYRSLLPSPTRTKSSSDEERGVHGGEYSVRPNMQESMVFLRKLFTHQHQEAGIEGFQNLTSPPSSPILTKNTNSIRRYQQSQKNVRDRRLGVYTRVAEALNGEVIGLENIEKHCLDNAKACQRLGYVGKMHTWEIISKVVRSRIKSVGLGLDGWGGVCGGSLCSGLIRNILNYYEIRGDVQMLSTIVCVLRSDGGCPRQSNSKKFSFLAAGQDARYNSYIRRYADLLYGWHLLTKRAEVMKHMTCSGLQVESDGSTEDAFTMGICFKCKCGSGTEFGTNYCRNCQDYAFRCTLCDSAVRGLFTVCNSCGHGGHVNHMKEWFTLHDECPSGCGCTCKQLSRPFTQRNVSGW